MPCTIRTQTAIRTASTAASLRKTIQLIGRSIVEGSAYLPLRSHAATLATLASPKDYFGQLKSVYSDFLNRWRYVRDPVHFECLPTDGPTIWGQTWGADVKGGKGWGDCDCASIALGAALCSIGFQVRIVTIAGLTSPGPLSHVYLDAYVPSMGWIAVDPVGHPGHGLGWAAPCKRRAVWDLDGNLLQAAGDWVGKADRAVLGVGEAMLSAVEENRLFPDLGLENYGMAGLGSEPIDSAEYGPVSGFGAYAGSLGLIGHGMGLLMGVDADDEIAPGLVRTKALEMSPTDWRVLMATGAPRMGAVALADDGDVYQYSKDPTLGFSFFKRIFKGIKRGFRKLKGLAMKLISKLPGGKYLVKLYKKIHAITMKIVRPLVKFVGKYAAKLAPIAAFIPGWGPAIAGGLLMAGKIAKILQKTGVVQDKKGKPVFKSGAQAVAFKAELNKAAKHLHEKRIAAHKAGKKLIIRPAIAKAAAKQPGAKGGPPAGHWVFVRDDQKAIKRPAAAIRRPAMTTAIARAVAQGQARISKAGSPAANAAIVSGLLGYC